MQDIYKFFLLILFICLSCITSAVYAKTNSRNFGSIHKDVLNVLDKTHETIAGNISNVNTPKYKSKFINKADAIGQVVNSGKSRVYINATNSRHISKLTDKYIKTEISKKELANKINGNNVDLTNETLSMSENELKRSETITGYKSMMNLLSASIGSR